MHTETPTKLSLWDFAQITGLNPLHLAGIEVPSEDGEPWCASPWIQYDWQDAGRVGREAVARAINIAEGKIEDYLGFRLLPTYEVGEHHQLTKPYRPEFVNYSGLRTGGFNQTFDSRWGWIVAYGRRQISQLTIIPQVVGSDPPADIVWSQAGYWEVGTVLVDVAGAGVLDPQEVRIFYPDHNGEEGWEIRPTTVVIDPVTFQATVTFRRELAVVEAIWNSLQVQSAEANNDDDFLDTVDVFRVFTDPSDEATLAWPCGGCGGTGGCANCTDRTIGACLAIAGNPRLGTTSFQAAVWNPTTKVFDSHAAPEWRSPDDVVISYLAGYRDLRLAQPDRDMSRQWKEAVAFFATSLLERPPCDCSADYFERWREDLSTSNPGSTAMGGAITRVTERDLMNPFGTRRGAIFAWKRVTDGEANGAVVTGR